MAAESAPQAASTADRAECRWKLGWQGFFAVTVALPTALAVSDAPDAQHAAITIGTAAALGLWHWQTALRHPDWEGQPAMLLWLAGVLVFTGLLLDRHGSYLFLVYGLFPQLFAMLERLRYTALASAALVVVVLWRTGVAAEEPTSARVLSVVGSVLLAVLVGGFITSLVRQSAARQHALEELDAAREQLAAASRRAGVLAERERLAREIHDTVAQGFTGIVMQLEASEEALDIDVEQARRHLDRAKRSARDSLAEVRRAVHAMRPEALEGKTLAEALDRSVRRWSDETGIPASCVTEGEPAPLHPSSEIALLRTAQEALANVAKHAEATRASVRLAYTSCGEVSLTVDDDGIGFAPEDRHRTDGHGLEGMAERVAALDGRMRIDSTPGSGATLTVTVPTATANEGQLR